jgi:signal transduction histidine kinase
MTSEHPRTIVLIDADTQNLQRMQGELNSVNYEVQAAQRALVGLDLARKSQPDMVITDLRLPDLSGRELAARLRGDPRFNRMPIIVMLRSEDEDQRETCIAAGANGFLEKPLILQALAIQVEFFFSGGVEGLEASQLDEAREAYIYDVVGQLEGRIRELEQRNADLQRIDAMKDTFIQLTAHELRTPLTLITGYSRLLEDHPPLLSIMANDEDLSTLISGLSESVGRMGSIIEDILTMSRIMTSKIELNIQAISPARLIQEVLRSYTDALQERNLTVHFNEANWPDAMRCDSEMMRLTFDNLLSNAVKYTPDGGHIGLKAIISSGGKLIRFIVRDTGIGIPQEKLESIFEIMEIGGEIATHTTSKTAFGGGGLGLGLAICKGIVEAHGGKIWAESPGFDKDRRPGSEFIIEMPLERGQEAQSATKKLKRIATPSEQVSR